MTAGGGGRWSPHSALQPEARYVQGAGRRPQLGAESGELLPAAGARVGGTCTSLRNWFIFVFTKIICKEINIICHLNNNYFIIYSLHN